MATYKATSWGRTRGPKNLAGAPGTAITLLANTNSLRSSNSDYKTEGYATENQRYLHVLVTDLNDTDPRDDAVLLFGYCHAFEAWFELGASTMDTPISEASANTAPTAASITMGTDSGNAPSAQVPSDREYRRYDIIGIDRVAFVHPDASEVAVFAACSTF